MSTIPFEAAADSTANAQPTVGPNGHHLRADSPWCSCGEPRENCVRDQVRTLFAAGPDGPPDPRRG